MSLQQFKGLVVISLDTCLHEQIGPNRDWISKTKNHAYKDRMRFPCCFVLTWFHNHPWVLLKQFNGLVVIALDACLSTWTLLENHKQWFSFSFPLSIALFEDGQQLKGWNVSFETKRNSRTKGQRMRYAFCFQENERDERGGRNLNFFFNWTESDFKMH